MSSGPSGPLFSVLNSPLLLFVGLGNPGKKYQQTPHNLGFDVLDLLASRNRLEFRKETNALTCRLDIYDRKAILVKPQTFMNLSGTAVREIAHFYKIEPKDVLLVSDDLDLPPGKLRLRVSGGAGGHNGLKSVIEHLGGENFPRLRIGVGRSEVLPSDVYLLSKVPSTLKETLEKAVVSAVDALEVLLKEGIAKTMDTVNRTPKDEVKNKENKKEEKK